MKFFYWNLNTKEKLIRSAWTGIVALVFLYMVLAFSLNDLSNQLFIGIGITVLYIFYIALLYRKLKREN
ncbi:hypothetical protein [Metasolibacillus meyeri]|uniref:hypothetical protein n=1 Tax=Metasolibacillus meyeri TaxID=1071052 RepID=UPI000D31524D|nr:hypothetical protein [Metasolibacillus meyeri]